MEVTSRPKFTLRGHAAGVTAICQWSVRDEQYLISGDQDGSLASWDLTTLRRISFSRVCISRVQSLRKIKLNINNTICDILLAQSRDDGVHIFNLTELVKAGCSDIVALKNFSTYSALFSRGDAINSGESEAILAYPSSIESYLITVRYLGPDIETMISGSAQRDHSKSRHTCSVFDIKLHKPAGRQDSRLFAAYEDGCICCFSFHRESTTTVPELGVTGLKIDLIFKCDTGFQDFISAYDLIEQQSSYILICGAPKKELVRIKCNKDFSLEPKIDRIPVQRQGVGAISVSPDYKCFASAGWDNTISLFSQENLQLIAKYTHHMNQVQDIIFVELSERHHEDDIESFNLEASKTSKTHYMCAASLDGTISISLYKVL